MGFLTDLVAFPLLGPVNLVRWVAGRVDEVVRQETGDAERLRAELVELQIRYELGEFAEPEYLAREAELLRRLELARELES